MREGIKRKCLSPEEVEQAVIEYMRNSLRFIGVTCTRIRAGSKLKRLVMGSPDSVLPEREEIPPSNQNDGDIFLSRSKKHGTMYLVAMGRYVKLEEKHKKKRKNREGETQ